MCNELLDCGVGLLNVNMEVYKCGLWKGGEKDALDNECMKLGNDGWSSPHHSTAEEMEKYRW
jgi:hypothetical protein